MTSQLNQMMYICYAYKLEETQIESVAGKSQTVSALIYTVWKSIPKPTLPFCETTSTCINVADSCKYL